MSHVQRLTNKTDLANLYSIIFEAVEKLADPFAIYDQSDCLIYCNQSYLQTFGEFLPAQLLGMSFSEIAEHSLNVGIYPKAKGQESAYLANRISKHKSDFSTLEQVLPTGQVERVTEIRLPSGNKVGLHSIVTEIADSRHLAEESNRAKSRFIANTSHEIRTPLVGILGVVDLLLEQAADFDHLPLTRIIKQSGETLLRIVNDVLDMAKIDAGKLELTLIPFDPVSLTTSIIERYKIRAAQKGLKLCVELIEDETLLRVGDDLRFGQVFENILSNSIKFTDEGFVNVEVHNISEKPLRLVISDTGIGMNEEQLSRVLNAFEQADSTSTRRFGGTGLGMSIAKHIIEAHNGELFITSRLGEGTRTVIDLPLEFAVNTEPQVSNSERNELDRSRFSNRKILIADDNEINRLIFSRFLESMGVLVTAVDDGQQALVAASCERYDLICLDFSMPVLNGLDALKELRSMFGRQCPPIIVVTANAMSHQISEYSSVGFDACLSKPFRRKELQELLDLFL